MEKRILGKTGEKVSMLGFGCMRLPVNGPDPSHIDEDLAIAMIHHAMERGIDYFDTAWPYHGSGDRAASGASEPLVGRALAGGRRDRVKLATKLPTWLTTSRADMNRILDQQLQRLQTSHIDFYLAHNLNCNVWEPVRQAGLFPFLEEARKDGRIRHCGFSFHDQFSLFEEIVSAFDWDFAQIQYNYLDRDYQAGRAGVALAAEKNLGLIVMEPLRGGFLIDHLPPETRAVLARVRPGWSPADWGLRWLWDQPRVHLVLSGMSAMTQLDENSAIAEDAAAGGLTADDQAALEQVCDEFKRRLKVNCTACGYCLPCPQGVGIPKNFSHYNDYFLADSDEVRSRARYYHSVQVADFERSRHCTGCGDCLEKCPQHLPIPDLMKDVHRTLESAA